MTPFCECPNSRQVDRPFFRPASSSVLFSASRSSLAARCLRRRAGFDFGLGRYRRTLSAMASRALDGFICKSGQKTAGITYAASGLRADHRLGGALIRSQRVSTPFSRSATSHRCSLSLGADRSANNHYRRVRRNHRIGCKASCQIAVPFV